MRESLQTILTLTLSHWEREQRLDNFRRSRAHGANTVAGSRVKPRAILPLRSLGGRGEGRGEVRVGLALAFAIGFTTLTLPACARLNVVATTPDLASIAREIGGDKIELTTLARPTEDPHFVDA